MTDQAPLTQEMEMAVDNVAAGSDLTTVIGEAHVAGVVTSVVYVPKADIVGADTNTRTVTLINKGADGNGAVTVAALTLNAASGTSADFDEKTVTLSGTAANLIVADGDVLAWTSVHAASGLADPGGTVRVVITRS